MKPKKDRFFIGRSFLFLEQTDSTNSFVLRNHNLLQTPGLVVYAGRQSSGRGRAGRTWYSDLEGNLYASLVIHPGLPSDLLPAMTIFAGLSVFEALMKFGLKALSIKWPNDILVQGKKVCGILCESKEIRKGEHAVVVGVGLNIKGRPEEFPEEIRHRVTTLESEGVDADRDEILELLVSNLDQILIQVHKNGPAHAFKRWQNVSSSLGKTVSFEMDGRGLEGKIQGLDERGGLLVRLSDGKTVPVLSGEVLYKEDG